MSASEEKPVEPLLRIVTPDTTPEEVAAIVTVLAAVGGSSEPAAPRRTPEWNRPARLTRETHRHGTAGWRSSSLPR